MYLSIHTSFRGRRKIFRRMNSPNLPFCDQILKVRVEKKIISLNDELLYLYKRFLQEKNYWGLLNYHATDVKKNSQKFLEFINKMKNFFFVIKKKRLWRFNFKIFIKALLILTHCLCFVSQLRLQGYFKLDEMSFCSQENLDDEIESFVTLLPRQW